LLTQGEIFQDERLSMDEEAAQKANEQGHPGILAGAGKSNDFRLDGVFADYGGQKLLRLLRALTRDGVDSSTAKTTRRIAELLGCANDGLPRTPLAGLGRILRTDR
jgi:hypothetical protein